MADASVRLIGFVLALVGGILGGVMGLRAALNRPFAGDVDVLLMLLGGAIAIVGALRGWKGNPRDGGVLAIAGGVVLLLAGQDVGGVLALVGGVLYLVN